MNWNTARFGSYVLGILAFAAMVLSQAGYGSYDATNFTYDPAPIDLKILAGFFVTGMSSVLAAIAWLKNWSRK